LTKKKGRLLGNICCKCQENSRICESQSQSLLMTESDESLDAVELKTMKTGGAIRNG
jgi:hypothetical protein